MGTFWPCISEQEDRFQLPFNCPIGEARVDEVTQGASATGGVRGAQDPSVLDGVIMGVVAGDPTPKCAVMRTFDKNGRIMRRVTPYDRNET
jgi:hypothetical protein